MKQKLLCVLLALTLIIGIVPMTVLAAEEPSPLSIAIETDKDSYTTFGIAEVTVIIENRSSQTIENINAEATFDNLIQTSGKTGESKNTLEPGESFEFNYKVMLGSGNDLNFFQKMWLNIVKFFRTLFSGKTNVTLDKTGDVVEKSTEIKFGKSSGTNTIKVWHRDAEINWKPRQVINFGLEDIEEKYNDDPEWFKDESKVKSWWKETEEFLNDQQEKGIISSWGRDSSALWTVTADGFNVGLLFEDVFRKEIEEVQTSNVAAFKSVFLSMMAMNSPANKITLVQPRDYDYLLLDYSAVIFEDTAKELDKKYDDYELEVIRGGYVDIEAMKNLNNSKVILINGNGGTINHQYVMSLGTFMSDEQMEDYKDDFQSNPPRLIDSSKGILITEEFWRHYYKDNPFNGSMIFFGVSRSAKNSAFMNELTQMGAKAIIGFDDLVNKPYKAHFCQTFFQKLSEGKSTTEAFEFALLDAGYEDAPYGAQDAIEWSDGEQIFPAKPVLVGDGNWKMGETSRPSYVPDDAVYFNGSYYKLYRYDDFPSSSWNWLASKAYCESLNGHLATITSQEEQSFLEDNILNNVFALNGVAVGGILENGNWTWVNGESWDYTANPIEPMMMNGPYLYVFGDGYWMSGIINIGNYFMCEWEA